MKTKNLLLTLLLGAAIFTHAQESQRVLFIGNSYVTSNNLPQLLHNVALSTGHDLQVDQNAPGGHTFNQHTQNTTTLAKINQGNWDFVVLQEQSQMPSFPASYVQNNVFPYAAQLNALIEQANPCGETLFYMTWGRQNGDQSNCPNQPVLCTYEGMDDLLQQRYTQMAQDNNALLSPVAAVWRYLRTHHPEIELYSADQSHPSLAGSYAAACTFYTVILREDPTAITFNSNLTESQANTIKAAAQTVVFDNLTQWFVGDYDAPTSISATINQQTVTFSNPNTTALNFEWDFGDGQSSTQASPTHQYAQPGTYTVTLNVYSCGEFLHTLQTDLVINSLSLSELTTTLALYPNPANEAVDIPLSAVEKVDVYTALGQRIALKFTQYAGYAHIDISDLTTGIYQLQVVEGTKTYRQQLVKQP